MIYHHDAPLLLYRQTAIILFQNFWAFSGLLLAIMQNGVECDHQKSIVCRQPGNWRIYSRKIMKRIELCLCGFEPTIERSIQTARVVGWDTSVVWDARIGNAMEQASVGQRSVCLHAAPCRRGGEEIPSDGFRRRCSCSADGLHHPGDDCCATGYGQLRTFKTM